LRIKASDSDFGVSQFLPAIKTIIPICLEDYRLAFAAYPAADKDPKGFLYRGSVGHIFLADKN
jgi:hypothetical protein